MRELMLDGTQARYGAEVAARIYATDKAVRARLAAYRAVCLLCAWQGMCACVQATRRKVKGGKPLGGKVQRKLVHNVTQHLGGKQAGRLLKKH